MNEVLQNIFYVFEIITEALRHYERGNEYLTGEFSPGTNYDKIGRIFG